MHVLNDEPAFDDEGIELADAETALGRAASIVRELASVSVKMQGHLVLGHRIVVEDEEHSEVGSVRFGDVIRVEA